MDATTLGTLLVGAGGIVGAVVAYLGKKGETALTGYSSLTAELQEERDRLDKKVTDLSAELMQARLDRAADQAEIARLRSEIRHGGQP